MSNNDIKDNDKNTETSSNHAHIDNIGNTDNHENIVVNDTNGGNGNSVNGADSGDNDNSVVVSSVEDTVGIEHIVSGNDNDYAGEIIENDSVVDVDDDRGLIEQGDNIVVWEITGFYDDKGKALRPRQLEKSPPVLVLSDSDGNEASFLLTKNLSFHLYRGVESVYKGYFGVSSKSVHDTDSSWRMKKAVPFIVLGFLAIVALVVGQFA